MLIMQEDDLSSCGVKWCEAKGVRHIKGEDVMLKCVRRL